MGEAMLFEAVVDGAGWVQLGPLRFAAGRALPAGRVQVAVRPEAWAIGPAGTVGPANSADGAAVPTCPARWPSPPTWAICRN